MGGLGLVSSSDINGCPYPIYERGLAGDTSGAKFDGHLTQGAIRRALRASGGSAKWERPWRPKEEHLTALTYAYDPASALPISLQHPDQSLHTDDKMKVEGE